MTYMLLLRCFESALLPKPSLPLPLVRAVEPGLNCTAYTHTYIGCECTEACCNAASSLTSARAESTCCAPRAQDSATAQVYTESTLAETQAPCWWHRSA